MQINLKKPFSCQMGFKPHWLALATCLCMLMEAQETGGHTTAGSFNLLSHKLLTEQMCCSLIDTAVQTDNMCQEAHISLVCYL